MNVYHSFWCKDVTTDGSSIKVMTAFKSLLRTTRNVRFILWTLPSCLAYLNKTYGQELRSFCPKSSRSYVEIRTTQDLIDKTHHSKNEALEQCIPSFTNMDPEALQGNKMPGVSDLIRFVALYYYGGIYFDADTLILRDMNELQNQNFAFKWEGTSRDFNTCVMGLKKGNPLPIKMIQHYKKCTPEIFHPERVLEVLDCPNKVCSEFIMYPTYLFDPMHVDRTNATNLPWQFLVPGYAETGDVYSWLFTRERTSGVGTFFPGAFTYHWHNNWGTPIHEKSFFAELQKINSHCLASSYAHSSDIN